ncbi:hypothetical protein BbINS_05557 [Bartonella bacilliformis INS]|uniref:Uncharacterized protein n=2 Tax=Bartonella bacilliformis TaxID=774 RepID=A1UTY9_BARBK|nr:conserved hypothetical protein [Bartonella bacilliformis KC583]EKS43076.1 hypothetical protein BbINS_05557 [Bartonella bacilliformis INS]
MGWLPIYLERQDLEVISSNVVKDLLKHNKQGGRYVWLAAWQEDKITKM